MRNAKEELLEVLSEINKNMSDVIAINVHSSKYPWRTPRAFHIFSSTLDETLLKELDFMYDAGYGSQELFGLVLFKDGSWLERSEYDGSEWWNYRKKPSVDDVINFNGEEYL